MTVAAQPPSVTAPLAAPARALWLAALLSLALKGWIAAVFPITGDEAFFYWWGVYPDWGYYDHPPMVGWLIALMRALAGDGLLSIRLPAVLLPLAVGAALWWGLAAWDRQRASWALLLFWLAPINWLNMLITTDTPLILWSALSAAALLRAEVRPKLDRPTLLLYAASGVFIGCAFLSKYFSVVMGLAYLVYFLLLRRERWAGLVVLTLCALPGPLINLAWNMDHGWSNIMFNAINRNESAGFEWFKPPAYLLMMAYLVTPGLVWLAWGQRQGVLQALRANRLLACVVMVPLGFFLLLSFSKVIGLHWVLSFYPFLFGLLALALPAARLGTAARTMAWFTALHVLAVVGIALSSPSDWASSRLRTQIVRSFHTAEILQRASAPGTELMANAYTPASIYGYERKRYMPVFGRGNFHARQDDLLVDFSVYQGKTLRVLQSGRADLADYAPYFDSVRALRFQVQGVEFEVVEGLNFNYPRYREGVLADIHRRYYNIPSWLPMTGCPFCERLCGALRCPR